MKKRVHEHYCQEHDHRWRCERDPCTLHEATGCMSRRSRCICGWESMPYERLRDAEREGDDHVVSMVRAGYPESAHNVRP